jgi:hypothetical protein
MGCSDGASSASRNARPLRPAHNATISKCAMLAQSAVCKKECGVLFGGVHSSCILCLSRRYVLQVAFSVGACGVAGVLDLVSARVTHVHHPRTHPHAPGSYPVDGVRRRLGWMGLWGRGAAVVTVDARLEADAAVLALPGGSARYAAAVGRGDGRAWTHVSSLEPATMRYVTPSARTGTRDASGSGWPWSEALGQA